MYSMTDQMEILSQKILTSKYDRISVTADITSYTRALLSNCREEREKAAAATQATLSRETKARNRIWRKQSSDIQRMLRGFHRDHARAAKERRAWRVAEQHSRAQATTCLIEDFRRFRNTSAQTMEKNLERFVHRMQTEVKDLIDKARASRQEMGRETAKELQETTAATRQRTDEIAAHSRGLMSGFHQARTDMAKQVAMHLVMSTDDRRRNVIRLLEGFRSSQRALRNDLDGAHQLWRTRRNEAAIPGVLTFDTQKPEQPPGIADEERILNIILEHPDGISVSQISEMLGVSTLLVGRVATDFAGNGIIRKDKKTRRYSPH